MQLLELFEEIVRTGSDVSFSARPPNRPCSKCGGRYFWTADEQRWHCYLCMPYGDPTALAAVQILPKRSA